MSIYRVGILSQAYECAMFALVLVFTISCFIGVSHASPLDERNYYSGEVKLSDPCLHEHMGVWGEDGTPEEGWYKTIEDCSGRSSTLETVWHKTLLENVTGFATDGNSRLSIVVLANMTMLEVNPVKAKGFSSDYAKIFANGMASTMAAQIGTATLLIPEGQCIRMTQVSEDFSAVVDNMVWSYHHLAPWLHYVETEDGWCFNEP